MAEFKLGRIRFVWKGDWTTATVYYKDDVVRVGGRTFICQVGHTSADDFNTDLAYNPTKWNQLTDGQSFKGEWNVSVFYQINDVVKYGGLMYICNESHTSAGTVALGLENDQSKWTLFAEGTDWKNAWTTSERYKINDIVRYGGYTYICNQAHTSAATAVLGLEADLSKWDIYNPGIEYKGDWTGASTRYKLNDVVKYGSGLYICITQHVGVDFLADSANWNEFVKGLSFESSWVASTDYKLGDIVIYGGNQYIAKTNHNNTSAPPVDSTNWELFNEGFNFLSAYDNTTSYKINDVVTLSGYSYVALQDSPSVSVVATATTSASDAVTVDNTTDLVSGMTIIFSGTSFGDINIGGTYYVKDILDGTRITITNEPGGSIKSFSDSSGTMTAVASLHPTTTTYWRPVSQGVEWKGVWTDDSEYNPGDAVRYGSNAYLCILKHRADGDDGSSLAEEGGGLDNSRPDLDISGTYWNLLCVGSEIEVLTSVGDLVYYGGAGPTRLPIGLEGQILRTSSEGIPEWATLGAVNHRYFVATHGVDSPAPTHGRTWDKPWRTIRYACEQVEKGPLHPDAQKLLELNRVFIQREVSKWIEYQISNNLSPFSNVTVTEITAGNTLNTSTGHNLAIGRRLRAKTTSNGIVAETDYYVISESFTATSFRLSLSPGGPAITGLTIGSGLSINLIFDFDEFKCERDVGFIVDALIYDLGHGGNVKTRGAANSYVGGLTPEETEPYLSGLGNEDSESVAALNYMLMVVEKVLNQEAPTLNYQILNGDNSTAVVSQHFNTDLSAEEGSISNINSLVEIVTDAIVAGNADNIPERVSPTNLINVATGQYREVLPIIVPEFTCVMGDELRSTNAGPASAGDRTLDVTDSKYSLGALGRMETIVGQIVQGTDVTESSGNIEIQRSDWPYSDATTAADAQRLIRAIQQNIDFRLGTTNLISTTDPTGYNVGYLTGYGDARKLIKENKKFFQEEVIGYITTNYPEVKYSKTICKRDVGYIVDAVIYDLTYGGNTQSINAGLAYYDGSSGALMIDSSEELATLAAYTYLKTLMQNAALNTATGGSQSLVPQYRDTAGSAGSATQIGVLLDIIYDIVDGGADAAPNITVTTITGTDTLVTGSAHNLLVGDSFTPRSSTNGLVKNEKYWIVDVSSGTQFKISDSFGGSPITITNGTGLSIVGNVVDHPAATDGVSSTTALITAAQTLDAAQETIIENVIDDLNTVAYHTDFTVTDTGLTNDDFVVYVGKHSLAHTYVSGGTVTKPDDTILDISNFVYNESTGYATLTTSTDHGLEAGDIVNIEEISVSCTSGGNVAITVFPSQFGTQNGITKILYVQNKCIRDTRLILEAVMFDFMFNSNFQATKAAYSYLRSSATEVFSLGQKNITRDALTNAKDEALANVGGDATAQARITSLMTTLDDVIFSGSIEGNRCATDSRMADYAVLQLERNRDYMVSEISAWIASTYTDTATDTTLSSDVVTISDTSWLQRNAAVRFFGNTFGGIESGVTYYIQNIVSPTQFKVATTRNATSAVTLTTASGSMTMSLYYDSALCLRDVGTYIDALKYDLRYIGNYKSLFASRYYANAAKGSLEEDMFYLRDATGLRDMTLQGLTGDLLAPNEYGTSRVSAGAYASLDPGWGPDDYRTWIMTRSPYVQGLTTFGTAAIGQKIDGALHNGGNDSITSNDFTQVISDGIGAWVANNGRAELVSVFTYYAHIGYLSTEGGRIRGTNGNNSYGDFGSVAEGVDPTETPGLAAVDNRFQFVATVGSVFGDSDEFYQLELDNAGIDYSEVEWTFSGGGNLAASENDEFRDDAVYQVRLLDLGDDSSGQFGGEGYISNSNTAQGGTSSSLTLAATDGEISGAYVGMAVYITGGSGAGQYGYVTSYNAGTKVAAVVKEDGSSGWEHVIPGTTIASPDASTTYVVEPRITFSSPGFTQSFANLPKTASWSDVIFGQTNSSYVSLNGTYSGDTGTGAVWTVIRNGYKYFPVLQSAGANYNRLETITIAGTSLGGITPTNDLVITITAIDTSTGAILEFDHSGDGIGGIFVVTELSGADTATSTDGVTWTSHTSSLPLGMGQKLALAWGSFNDGSSLERTDTARFVVVGIGEDAAYSTDGITWQSSLLPNNVPWTGVAFGNGRFVAVNNTNTTVAISFDGEVWDNTGALPSTGNWKIAYGAGRFVAVKPGDSGAAAYSTDGVTWTAVNMPTNSTWVDITWGLNKFVAIASDSNDAAYTNDRGESWDTATIGSLDGSSIAGFEKIRYGQGLFMITAENASAEDYSYVCTSENGFDWNIRGIEAPPGQENSWRGWGPVAFGSPQRSGIWAILPSGPESVAGWIRTGATARARAFVAENKIFAIRITEPGSGYDVAPTMTITDPNNTFEVPFSIRTGKGVLAQPSWTNRGNGYATASAEVFSGDGYGDFFQSGSFVAVRRMTVNPAPGSNVEFEALPGRTFKLVNVITFLGTNEGAFTSFYQISPELSIQEAASLTHLSSVETRLRYSQVRLTGHDFLDIGTGSFIETNYPGLPTQDPIPANETHETNGGRVFFTSTDQDGNFRVGDLFSIEQSTGIATLNADAFNISGLQELNLGNVTLGGGSATVTEFSTDPFFTADSDSIVPTQRAIKAFIAAQIGGGGAALNVNSVTAGSIKISGNTIENITGSAIKMNAVFEFRAGVTGLPLAFHYFLN